MYVLACVLALHGGGGTLSAQPFHQEIRKSLVYLHASAKVQNGQPVETYATGFLVSPDGLILTVYHLLSKLGNYVPETVTIEARIEDTNTNLFSAAIIDATVNIDIMLLKIPPTTQPYAAVTLGSPLDHVDATAIHTSGFSQPGYRIQQGYIQARTGPGGSLWTTGFTFRPGESGSPLYNDKGEVLGLVKGDDAGAGYMIPIGFADSLLAQIRLRKIQQAMQDFDVLRKQFDWNGETSEAGGRQVITISYEKRVAGDPQVKSIDISVRVHGTKAGKEEIMPAFEHNNIPLKGSQGTASGTFEPPGLREKVEHLRDQFTFTKIGRLEVKVVPTLADGSQLPSRRIWIDY